MALSADATREQAEKAVRGDYAIVYLTPEKAEGALGLLQRMYDNAGICVFAIDECHCVSQWGHSFRASYLRLRVLRDTFPQVPIAALSATATHHVLVRLIILSPCRLVVARVWPCWRVDTIPITHPIPPTFEQNTHRRT